MENKTSEIVCRDKLFYKFDEPEFRIYNNGVVQASFYSSFMMSLNDGERNKYQYANNIQWFDDYNRFVKVENYVFGLIDKIDRCILHRISLNGYVDLETEMSIPGVTLMHADSTHIYVHSSTVPEICMRKLNMNLTIIKNINLTLKSDDSNYDLLTTIKPLDNDIFVFKSFKTVKFFNQERGVFDKLYETFPQDCIELESPMNKIISLNENWLITTYECKWIRMINIKTGSSIWKNFDSRIFDIRVVDCNHFVVTTGHIEFHYELIHDISTNNNTEIVELNDI